MQVCTRFAPTISGELHIGGLYNALLNYLYAKKNGGSFNLRLDGCDMNPPHDVWQQNIQRDLELFGLNPDRVIKASNRVETYKEVAVNLDKTCDRSYHCDCTVQDLLKRAHKNDSKFYHLYRPEKYPPYCKIVSIAIRGPESGMNLAADCAVETTHEAINNTVKNVTARGNSSAYWEPVDIGYINHPIEPEIVIDLGCEKQICSIEIKWKDRPVLEYVVSLSIDKQSWCNVVHNKKFNNYFVDYKQGQSFPPLTSEHSSFATTEARYVKVKIIKCAVPVDRPYFYDYHCRVLKKHLDITHKDAVLRLVADESISKYDAAYWYGKMPNLVLMSSYDDAELGITHCIRGADIEPWLALEEQVSLALKTTKRQQIIHGLVVDEKGYKYSKWIESTPVRMYLNSKITTEKILSYLAYKAGLIGEFNVLSLCDITQQFNGIILRNNVNITEKLMLEELERHNG